MSLRKKAAIFALIDVRIEAEKRAAKKAKK